MIALKDNQPKLHSHIKRIAALKKPTTRVIKTEKTRDRLTTRMVEVFNDVRAIALNILRRNGHTSMTIAPRFISHDIDKLLRLVE
ncbi:hypothetical protein [Merismopedia glauca]|uniref:Uncharacterized protein n=1 Tax=Merismopedia glauca CCAP 1448/3 TaxID=1296344 RepID=A0A2T1BYX9_9CYAN|nr:hypothetical protein [Merismopedia glauca]PSB01221.1 hypothetical protein C7B64_19410 [Merismopedia glauca CCAP 1448/3]